MVQLSSGSSGKNSEPGRDRRSALPPNSSELAGIGVQFIIAILLFMFVGKWLDSRLGSSPIFMIVGVFFGAGASMFAMYRKIFPPENSGDSSKPPDKPKSGAG